jgi:6-hydroxymethylpterin diphosphokinase MptE-like
VTESGALNVQESQARDNVRINTATVDGRQWKQVRPHLGRSEDEVMILGGGPSLAEYESEIRAKRTLGIKAVTMNGSYSWALERGLAPVTQIVMDARPFNARFVQPIREDCLYLIASQCDPTVFTGLPHERTYVWHTMIDLTRDILTEHYPDGWYRVLGGSTVLLRAIPLLGMLGYRRFTLYGCDSCLIDDDHHAYSQPENDTAPVVPIIATTDGRLVSTSETEGRIFYCHPWMIAQASQFVELIRSPIGDDIELDIKGDGLLKHILTVACEAQERAEAHA